MKRHNVSCISYFIHLFVIKLCETRINYNNNHRIASSSRIYYRTVITCSPFFRISVQKRKVYNIEESSLNIYEKLRLTARKSPVLRAAGAAFREAQLEAGHERRRRVTTPCVRPPTNHTHRLFIYVYLTGFSLVPSSFHCCACCVMNNRRTGRPAAARTRKVPRWRTNRGRVHARHGGPDRKIYHLRAPQSRRTVSNFVSSIAARRNRRGRFSDAVRMRLRTI